MNIQTALKRITEGGDLTRDEMTAVMQQIMTGQATDSQIGGFLIGLRMKGETIDEIAGAATVMRSLATNVVPVGDRKHMVDTCGTGGDGSGLFNISTASAFVVAAAGGKVAKHGNRSVSSKVGSADLLEAAGINLQLSPDAIARAIEDIGVGFMFAQAHHRAMKYAIGPRREMAVRTIFNVLGPITNPAGVTKQVIGVFDGRLCRVLCEALQRLGSEHILVVHSEDGLDELSLAAPTSIAELKDGSITEYSVRPEDFGLTTQSIESLRVNDSDESLALIQRALDSKALSRSYGRAARLAKPQEPADDVQTEAARAMIALNAGAAIYAADLAATLTAGVIMAQDAIASGLALAKMHELASFSQLLQGEA